MTPKKSDNKELNRLIINTRKPLITTRVVYTSIFGNSDSLKEVEGKDPTISYECFTDNKNLKSDSWNITYCEDFLDSPRLTAKSFKVFPLLVFPNSAASLWLDASFKIKRNLTELFDKYTYSSSIVCHRHPKRDCLYKEAKVCMLLGMDEREIIRNQIREYKELGMPKKDGLMHGGVLLRHHKSQEICKLMEDWWLELNTHSIRDQFSLKFLSWFNGIELNYIPGTLYDSDYFEWQKENTQAGKNIFKRLYQKVLIFWIETIG